MGRFFSILCYGSIALQQIANQLSDKDIDKTEENGIVYIFDIVNGYEAYQMI